MDKQQTNFGSYLKRLREAQGLTLRAVQEKTGISNAHLSQLESGRTKRPSPIMIHKLAAVYAVTYESLMKRAGYPVPEPTARPARKAGAKERFGDITPEEEDALLEYLSFLRRRRKRK